MSEVETPILVNESPVPDQLWVLIRDVMKITGGYLVGKGWLDAETFATISGLVLIVGPMVWAQLKARSNAKKLTTLATVAPDSIAQVKA